MSGVTVRRRVTVVLRDTARSLRGRDLSLWAAGVTFFAVLAVVPLALVALRGAAFLGSPEFVHHGVSRWADALPPDQRPGVALTALANAALNTPWGAFLVTLLPATFYGEGLYRGLVQVAGRAPGAFVGWRGRLMFVPVLLLSPTLAVVPLATADLVADLYTGGGWSTFWGITLSFHIDWLLIALVTGIVFVGSAPRTARRGPLLLGSLAVASILTGFFHGFLLFLAIPLDWSIPFGGLAAVGVVSALVLWLYLLHVLLLLGFRLTLSVEGTRAGLEPATEKSPESASESAS
ncbi:YhjD/YihY/BrkB family envelope integrity protein [Amycolatopsis sp. QT-25]|uniref:YhjD/YihY/BrkB family envelope integrity protein n=1 Tax=Amycolatopsis sp. QT-25 TaxID=3034022 RepID=UPI0023EB415A|nr:YhjD/YihY/BrkB family envelope integrity protein [Amycolatopsis sp. QT-25]WET76783.1 YhjD/YihY/BrkB family envelope integrity protein [Amycolatopsis sp. QT-25]